MLGTDDRRLYSECFAAPEGYVLDCAVGTTYSLDLESLLFAHVCIATSGRAEPDGALRDPVSVLEAVHRTSERVTVFCHAGETNAPSQPQAIYSLLESSIVPARGRGGGAIFHPKLWLLRFRALGDGNVLLRAVVLSRNITTSRAWDSFVCLEGEPQRGRQDTSRGLAQLLRALPSLATAPLTPSRAAALEKLAVDAERTAFAAPAPFEGLAELVAVGTEKDRGFRPAETGDRVLAISPFVSPETLRAFRKLAPIGDLVGRPEEMSKCPREVIAAWSAHTLHDDACSGSDAADDGTTMATAEVAPQGLHVKALAIQTGRRTTWWLGSGNLTDPVRTGSSVELMVRLEGKSSHVGIESFLESGFRDLLQPYTHAPPPDDPQEGARSAVERAKCLLVDANLSARCEARPDGWDIILEGAIDVPEGVSMSARPVSLPASRARELSTGVASWRFEHVSVEALTALFAFRLVAGKGEAAFSLELTLKLPLEGLPAERDTRITRAIVKDRAAFLRYLECLLEGVDGVALDGVSGLAREPRVGEGTGTAASPFAPGLLEQLLRALHRDPARLTGVRALLERTEGESEGDGLAVIPPELRELWRAIEPHIIDPGATSGAARTERAEAR